MKDDGKTREQLINETNQMRQRIAQLRALEVEHRKTERVLKVSKELFEKTFLSLDSGIFILDNKTPPIILDANPATIKIFGYKEEEMLGRTTEFLHVNKETLSEFQKILYPRVEKEGHLSFFEFKMKRKNGEIFPTEHSELPLKDEKGNRIGWVSSVRDITERRKVEESMNLLSTAVRTSVDAISVASPINRKLIFCNEAFLKWWKIKGNYHNLSYTDCFDVEPNVLSKAVQATMKGGWQGELIAKAMDGQTFPILVTSSPIIDKEGKTVGLLGIFKDITGRKRAEEILRESESHYRFFAENVIDVIWTMDMNLHFTYITPSVEHLLGYSVKEIMTRNLNGILTPSSFEVAMKTLAEELAIEKIEQKDLFRSRTLELEHIHKNGSIGWAEVKATPIRDSGDNLIGILGVSRDITERKKTEEALWESQERYRALVENTALGITIIDTNYKIIMVNATFAKLFKKSASEFVGKNCFREYEKRQAVCSHCPGTRAMASGNTAEVETQAVLDDGSRIHVRNRAIPFFGLDGVVRGFIEIVENIDERKKAEQALKDAYRKLKETQEQLIQSAKMAAIGQLASGISHELNQPLTGIKGFAQAALLEMDRKSPIRKDLKRIVEQSERMDSIIKNIRLFARKSDFNMKRIDINQCLKNSLRLLSEQLKLHNIKVKKSLAKDLPKIKGNANQLQQVFLNLITNARDAIESLKSGQGGELIVKSSLSEDKSNIQITFQDTGCGIPKKDLANLFNPFFTTKSPEGGMGLGLSIAYRIIESHRGTIGVESIEGKGTTFKIVLPVA